MIVYELMRRRSIEFAVIANQFSFLVCALVRNDNVVRCPDFPANSN